MGLYELFQEPPSSSEARGGPQGRPVEAGPQLISCVELFKEQFRLMSLDDAWRLAYHCILSQRPLGLRHREGVKLTSTQHLRPHLQTPSKTDIPRPLSGAPLSDSEDVGSVWGSRDADMSCFKVSALCSLDAELLFHLLQ